MDRKNKMPDGRWRLRGETKQRALRLGIAMLMCLALGASEQCLPDTWGYTVLKFALCICIAVMLLTLLKNPGPSEKDGDE